MNRHLLAALLGIVPALVAAATPASPAAGNAPKAAPSTPAAAPAKSPGAVAPGEKAAPAAKPAAPVETYAYFKAPLFSEDFSSTPVAQVEGETITVAQLTGALAGLHVMASDSTQAGKRDFGPVLERLINARLLVVEAREMGIDELPEFKDSVKEFRRNAGQEILKERVVKDVKADPAELDRVYKDMVREWKVRSVLIYQEANAKAFQASLKAGKSFEALAKQAVADKKGEWTDKAEFLPRAKMLPQILAALGGVKPGQVSPSAKVDEGWAIMEVQDVRYPEDPAARAQAEKVVLSETQKKALQDYYVGLVKKYAKVNKALLQSVDFDAPRPGLAALQKDRRALATFPGGEKPITVGDLADTLAEGFFHGADRAAKGKKINQKKLDAFDGLLSRKVVPLEATAQHVQDTQDFGRRVSDFESNLLFTRFIEKVIIPEMKIDEAAVKKYWEAHKSDYTYPAFWRLESLAFKDVKSAQGAIDKLRSGTDFKWLNANAEGQLKPGDRKVPLGGVLADSALPKDVAAALRGAKKGDFRLYESPESQYYAVYVVDYTPPSDQPFEEVRETVTQRLYLDRLGKAIEEWAGKLRKLRKVEVFITRIGS
jgi:parvulin-like peptidyl-prolyl isomerase